MYVMYVSNANKILKTKVEKSFSCRYQHENWYRYASKVTFFKNTAVSPAGRVMLATFFAIVLKRILLTHEKNKTFSVIPPIELSPVSNRSPGVSLDYNAQAKTVM